MSKAFSPKVVTANALIEGDVVYQTADDRWTRELAKAEILTEERYARLRLEQAEGQPHEVVGAYLIDVTPATNGPEPTHFREDFRRRGPSNYFHGKQAELG
jgi:hypothetical protein